MMVSTVPYLFNQLTAVLGPTLFTLGCYRSIPDKRQVIDDLFWRYPTFSTFLVRTSLVMVFTNLIFLVRVVLDLYLQ